MRHSKYFFLLSVLLLLCNGLIAQCAEELNIYSFEYNGHLYEVVKENKSWTDASNCAVSRGGYLAEINDEAEQTAIFNELTANSDITITDTQNQFGTASIWLGGSDAGTEGDWIWDGNNDGTGPQFWSGTSNGDPVDGLYTNWGTSPAEPDNSGGQDYLTIIIKPTAVNYGLWNDLISTNTIYYLIEYDSTVSIENLELKENVRVYPNPFSTGINIENSTSDPIKKITVLNLMGPEVKTMEFSEVVNAKIAVADLESGMYILNIHFENGELTSQKILK